MVQVHVADNRQVHVKVLTIAGRPHFVTVLPPGDIEVNDVVWAKNDRPDRQDIIAYDGPGSLAEYALTKRDLSE